MFWRSRFTIFKSLDFFKVFVEIEVSTIVTFFSDLFKINFHASIWHFSNYSTSACSNNHFLLETDFTWHENQALFVDYESSNRRMNNHKHLNNPDTYANWQILSLLNDWVVNHVVSQRGKIISWLIHYMRIYWKADKKILIWLDK